MYNFLTLILKLGFRFLHLAKQLYIYILIMGIDFLPIIEADFFVTKMIKSPRCIYSLRAHTGIAYTIQCTVYTVQNVRKCQSPPSARSERIPTHGTFTRQGTCACSAPTPPHVCVCVCEAQLPAWGAKTSSCFG